MKEIPQNVSESTKKRNPHLYPVARLGGSGTKPAGRSEGQNKEVEASKTGFRCSIVSFRAKPLDEHDNLRFAHKALVDRITEWLGFKSDSDPRLEWEYHQIISKVRGTLVNIQRLTD